MDIVDDLALILNTRSQWSHNVAGALLRVTVVNRTYGTHKKLYI